MTLRKFILERIREREEKAETIRQAGYERRLGGQFADHLPILMRLDAEAKILSDVLEDYAAVRR